MDGGPNRRNKAVFFHFSGVVRTLPKNTWVSIKQTFVIHHSQALSALNMPNTSALII